MSRRSICLLAAGSLALALAACAGGDTTTIRAPAALVEQKKTPFRGNVLPTGIAGAPAPAFRLADAREGRLDSGDLRGRPYAVTFLYTKCKDVCPAIAAELRRALTDLGRQAARVAVVAVSVDPQTDTLSSVRGWLRKFRLPPNFHYLIGSRAQLQPVWKAYYVAPQPNDPDVSSHSASIWMIAADGRIATKYSAGVPVSPSDVAHDFRVLLKDAG